MIRTLLAAAAIALCTLVSTAQAQHVGIGVGLAAAGDNIGQAGGELTDLFQKDSITYGDISGNIGFYVAGKAYLDLGPIRLLGDLSYVYFQAKQITLTDASVNTGDSTVSATFEVGSSMVPIYVGAAFVLPSPVVKPYLGAQVGYTYVSRTYSYVNGNQQLKDLNLQNKSAGDPEVGLALSAGVSVELPVISFDVGARYNFANLFSTSANEKPMKYLQVGAAVFF